MRLAVFLLVLPCAAAAAQQPPLRTPRVVADFGGATNDPATEMLRVGGVIRVADGRFVVGNGDPVELRVYDASGRVQGRFGQMGAGPGEFRSVPRVFPWPGDSVQAYSSSNARWMLFTLDGKLVREWPADVAERPSTAIVLHGSALMPRAVVGSHGCPGALLDRLAPRDAKVFSVAMTDQSGRLWIRRGDGDTPWTVHDSRGVALARLRLPTGFEPMQFTESEVIGLRRDDDGFFHVMAVESGLPAAAPATAPPCGDAPLPIDRVRAAMIKTGMRNAMTFGESYYSDHKRYPGTSGDYPSFVKPDGTDFVVLAGGGDGYIISIVDRKSGWRCVVSVGSTVTSPLPEGTLVCG